MFSGHRIIVFIFSICCIYFCLGQGPAGPPGAGQDEPKMVLNFDSPVYVCSDDVSQSFVDASSVEVMQFNESTATMLGTIKFLKGMEDSTMVLLEISKETAGGRHEIVLTHDICDLCAEVANNEGNYKKYLQYFGFPENCPFEAGDYKIHDLVADTSEIPLKKSNEGRYQVTINILKDSESTCKDGTFLACLKLDVIIEELLLK